MRLIVLFDLPVKTKRDKKAYRDFHRFLIGQGYYLIQFSVYGRVCGGLDRLYTQLSRLRAHVPPKGSVRCMTVTEKQYAAIEILVGESQTQEKPNNYEQLTF